MYNFKKIIVFLRNFVILPSLFLIILSASFNLKKLTTASGSQHANFKENYFDKFYNFDEINIKNLFNNSLKPNLVRTFPDMEKNLEDQFGYSYSDFSSGRWDDWNEIILKNDKIIIGYGVMGDRFLIDQTASSLIFYSYASSGLLGALSIIIASLLAFFKTLKLFLIEILLIKIPMF